MKVLLIMSLLVSFTVQSKEVKKLREIILSEENSLVLDKDFSGDSVSALIERAREIDSKVPSTNPIYLFLYTPGGSIQAGLELYEAFKGLNRPVHTITLFAASMGFQTVQQLGKRYILKNGVLMSHKAKGQIYGEFGDQVSQMDSRYGLWLEIIKELDEDTVRRTNGKQSLKSYRAAYENELWLLGQRAVDQGYADEVISVKCDSTMAGTRSSTSNFFGLNVVANFSKCPINTTVISTTVNLETTQGIMTIEKFLAKGGTFGKECYDNFSKQREASLYNGTFKPNESPVLVCLIDTELTLEKIKLSTQKFVQENSKSLVDKVRKTY